MSSSDQPESKEGVNGAIAKLIGQLNLPTLLAIFAMNGWGIQTTNQTSQQREAQIQQAVREIHILHEALDDFQKRQQNSLDNQGVQLSNQTKLLQGQQAILNKIEAKP